MTTRGGKTVFSASVGILMLNTRFPRIPGDIGNAATWPFPVHYKVIPAATPDNVVRGDASPLLGAFIDAGRELLELGCDGIATNCGFLVPFQTEMSRALGVPVASSSLLQAPLIRMSLPADQTLGILTISSETLTTAHLDAAGIPHDTPVGGTGAGSHFTTRVLGDADEIDFDQARADNVNAALRLVHDNPNIGAILLECTNMVPYAADIRRATGRPVFSIYTYLLWFQAGLLPRRFPNDLDDVPWRG
ncbi:aspartate/glutamate racemase family protein [Thalassobacter stenotrophicus]|uniref:aspartate/glutamate racemase family protein n=1 Tax=Thalassobacter stenotrophicus TaxID=266809 RepID=UPI0022A99BE5|nr:aspartate/glutamate racemase family protein [Thalassobacter stenotrophicus]UYP66678.1 aspartate/glutamate racemase family protein [Thalassobacter stenotrophicus]